MSQVEIKATIDANNPSQLSAAIAFLNSLGNGQSIPQQEQKAEAPKEEAKKETPKKEQSKKAVETSKEEAKTEEQEAEAPKKEPAKVETKANGSEIKIEDVRALLAKKVNEHRTEIKTKLTELKANNVTSLKSENYEEFIDFLNSL